MTARVKLAILEDHQSIIDGYMYRLEKEPRIQVVGTCLFGSELAPLLEEHQVDVLLMDLSVPVSPENHAIYPIRHELDRILNQYPDMKVIVISVFDQQALIRSLVDIGIRGYILKDDQSSIKKLTRIIKIIADGGMYFGENLNVFGVQNKQTELLTPRQIEVLSLCIAYPDLPTSTLADKMGISGSTFRNLLSDAYRRLDVRTRGAAVIRVQELGLILGKASSIQ